MKITKTKIYFALIKKKSNNVAEISPKFKETNENEKADYPGNAGINGNRTISFDPSTTPLENVNLNVKN
jgi:hypothetical protein